MKRETTAEFLVRAGKKAVVRLGDIACRGQLPRLAPTSSAFMHERRDSLAFSVCHHVFNFAAWNYILCKHYTVCEKSACIYVSLRSSLSISESAFCLLISSLICVGCHPSARHFLLQYFTFADVRDLFLIHRDNSEIATEAHTS